MSLPSSIARALGPHARLLGMALLWGASWPAGRVIAQEMPALAAASLRFLLASLVLLPWLYYAGGFAAVRQWQIRQWAGMAAAAATGVFGYAACFLSGLQHLPAGKAALIITLNPVMTLLLARWLFAERLNASIAIGMLLAASGAAVVISQGDPLRLLQGSVGQGEWLILGCVCCWVAYTLLGRWMLVGVQALATTAITSTLGSLMLLLCSLLVEGTAGWAALAQASTTAWWAMGFLAFGATAVAYAWYFDGVKALGASAASGYITLVPVVGVIISAWWLAESLERSMFIGGSMAVLGTALMHRGRAAG